MNNNGCGGYFNNLNFELSHGIDAIRSVIHKFLLIKKWIYKTVDESHQNYIKHKIPKHFRK